MPPTRLDFLLPTPAPSNAIAGSGSQIANRGPPVRGFSAAECEADRTPNLDMAGFPPGVTRFGENTQDMPTGALIQDSETGLLSVPSGVIVN